MEPKKSLLIETIGWYGALGILGAFGLQSLGVLSSGDIAYQAINFTAALGIVAISLYKKVYQLVLMNSIWAIFALYGIIKILL